MPAKKLSKHVQHVFCFSLARKYGTRSVGNLHWKNYRSERPIRENIIKYVCITCDVEKNRTLRSSYIVWYYKRKKCNYFLSFGTYLSRNELKENFNCSNMRRNCMKKQARFFLPLSLRINSRIQFSNLKIILCNTSTILETQARK